MGDISMPPNLNQADAALNLISLFEKILDGDKRKQISSEIVQFHALNETESKKLSDARSLIERHSAILDETRKLNDGIALEKKSLAAERKKFEEEMEAERIDIASEKSKLKSTFEEASKLNEKALLTQNEVANREGNLENKRLLHEAEVKKFSAEKSELEKTRKSLDDYKNQIMELDKTTNAKVEKLRQFNF